MTDLLLKPLVASLWAETREVCARLARDVLALESALPAVDAEQRYASLRRGLHNLKGSAATLGLKDVASFAHALEETVAPLAQAGRPLATRDADALLSGLDELSSRVRAHVEGEPTGATVHPPWAREARESGHELELEWRVAPEAVRSMAREVERLRELYLRLAERRRSAAPGESARARADTEDAASIVASLEESLKAICTQPVATITDPLQRAVRDLCRASGKQARLGVVGAEMSLDRRVLEVLRGALVQLVRNAVDHGLEDPASRDRAGKHREGSVVIRVEQQGNLAFIEVSDDGRGLDDRRILEAAVERGFVTPAEAASMTAEEVHDLIFRPSFSTRVSPTEVSGRGMGLDLVRANVTALQGRVDVESTPGGGTRFLLTIPSLIGSTPVMLVRSDEQSFAIPVHAVDSIVCAGRTNLVLVEGATRLDHRSRTFPVEDLGALLRTRTPVPCSRGDSVMVIQAKGERAALRVDEVVGDFDLRILPLPDALRAIPSYQGAVGLPGGDLVLVLRPEWLVSARAQAPLASSPRALVIDDSLTARALHRAMLEAGGYVVHTVADAEQAVARARTTPYQVIVCDVAMEPVDGYALVTALRRMDLTRATPVVLVTAHDSPDARARGVEVGADGFLSKGDCAEGKLLAVVARAVAGRGVAP